MKIMRFALPGAPSESKVGLIDLGNNQVVDSATVLGRIGIRESFSRAVDLISYNVEKSGALSQGLKDLDRHDAPRWGLDEVVFSPSIEAGSLRDFIAFEQHIRAAPRPPGRRYTRGLVPDAHLLQRKSPVFARPRSTANLATVLPANGL